MEIAPFAVPAGLGMLASSRFGIGDGVFRTVSIPRELLAVEAYSSRESSQLDDDAFGEHGQGEVGVDLASSHRSPRRHQPNALDWLALAPGTVQGVHTTEQTSGAHGYADPGIAGPAATARIERSD
jgi:hypothetical protein